MDVLIYGGGAVGLGWSSCLIKTGVNVSIVSRPSTVDALQHHGLVRDGIFGTAKAPPDTVSAYSCLEDVPPGYFDYVVVSTKSFDSPQAAADLHAHRSKLGLRVKWVLAQNGWGNTEHFTAHFPAEQVYNARVITGFERKEPHKVTVTVHADAMHIGSLCQASTTEVAPLAEAISQGDIPCVTTDRIAQDLWAKMLFNCTLNPLGAILKVSYGDLGAQPSTQSLMNHIADEIFAVCHAAGFPLHWDSPDAFRQDFYGQQVPATANHHSSTLQDIQAGKRTEIDALNGQVLALAQCHGVATPYNDAVYHLIKFIETSATPLSLRKVSPAR